MRAFAGVAIPALISACAADGSSAVRASPRAEQIQIGLSRIEAARESPKTGAAPDPLGALGRVAEQALHRVVPASPPPGAGVPGAGPAPAPADTTTDSRGPMLVATAVETPVYAKPSTKAKVIGTLRRGAVVSRSAEPSGNEGCRNGLYEISPDGFVCVGTQASIDPDHPLARVASRRAERGEVLPYVYTRARVPAVPVYSRVPTTEELVVTEPHLSMASSRQTATAFDGLPFDDAPAFLTGAAPSLSDLGLRPASQSVLVKSAVLHSGFALVTLFESAGRRYGLTADLTVVPLDAVAPVEPSQFHGVPLAEGAGLPVVFARSRSAALYTGDPHTHGLHFERRLDYREAMPLTGKRARVDAADYLETASGQWISDGDYFRVVAPAELPPWAVAGKRWIDVSIDHQSLIAYEGTRPVFVTLVSTGKDGAADPETTRSTVQGEFRIHTKYVTATMDSEEIGDEYELRDVPYVQYFRDGYAFHAVYWHDGFGTPHSHGCVNLSPMDARWLFSFTDPPVPQAWHGARSARGTLVSIHR